MNENINIIKSEYIISAVSKAQYPEESLPEFAFIGRSNVGKSSLINSLCNRKNLARTSQTPGKTQTINFFRAVLKSGNNVTAENNLTVENNLTSKNNFTPIHLVDLPGYGYAKTSKTNRRIWAKFIEEYLLSSPNLKFVCQLVDMRHAPMDSDKKFFAWLVENNVPVLVIATKADKLSKNEQRKQLAVINNSFGVEELSILPYSSQTHAGRSDLLQTIFDSGAVK
ncbi:MAG: YihA family ribosome biogenesis GTP-binding protein [Selenomonadaceae bacterium]|nr:YihA family ribosome biogenesis GTP-binding protein [Selenomonadaceae bacterium]